MKNQTTKTNGRTDRTIVFMKQDRGYRKLLFLCLALASFLLGISFFKPVRAMAAGNNATLTVSGSSLYVLVNGVQQEAGTNVTEATNADGIVFGEGGSILLTSDNNSKDNSKNQILMMNNVTITGPSITEDEGISVGLYSANQTPVSLLTLGNVKICGGSVETEDLKNTSSCGIFAFGDVLTFSNDELTVCGGDAESSFGIFTSSGFAHLSGKMTIKTGEETSAGIAIYVPDGDILIKDGSLSIETSSEGIGIMGLSLEMDDGVLDIQVHGNSYGLLLVALSLYGGEINVTVKDKGCAMNLTGYKETYGLYVEEGKVFVSVEGSGTGIITKYIDLLGGEINAHTMNPNSDCLKINSVGWVTEGALSLSSLTLNENAELILYKLTIPEGETLDLSDPGIILDDEETLITVNGTLLLSEGDDSDDTLWELLTGTGKVQCGNKTYQKTSAGWSLVEPLTPTPTPTKAPESPTPTEAPQSPTPTPTEAPESPTPTEAPQTPTPTEVPQSPTPTPTKAPQSPTPTPQPTTPTKAPEPTKAEEPKAEDQPWIFSEEPQLLLSEDLTNKLIDELALDDETLKSLTVENETLSQSKAEDELVKILEESPILRELLESFIEQDKTKEDSKTDSEKKETTDQQLLDQVDIHGAVKVEVRLEKEQITNFGNEFITVSIPVINTQKLPEHPLVIAISANGKIYYMRGIIKGDTVLVETNHLTTFLVTSLDYEENQKLFEKVEFVAPKTIIPTGTKVDFELEVSGYDLDTITWYTARKNRAVVGKNNGKLIATVSGKTKGSDTIIIKSNDKVIARLDVLVADCSAQFINPVKEMKVGDKLSFELDVKGYEKKDIVWYTKRKNRAVVGKNNGKTKVTVTAKSTGVDTLYVVIDGEIVAETKIKVIEK